MTMTTNMTAFLFQATAARKTTVRVVGTALALALLAGCSGLPKPPQRADIYDLGPGLVQAPTAVDRQLAPIALADFTSAGMPEGRTAVQYRLAYANPQLLHTYTLARWSQAPAMLLQLAVRDQLSQNRSVLFGDQNIDLQIQGGKNPTVLRAEVEEFSQVFRSERDSVGLVRLRVSMLEARKAGDELVAQRTFVAQRPAPTPDASGGTKALSEAAAQVASDIAQWVAQNGR